MTEEKNKKKQVLFVVDDVKTAQFRYRLQNVIEALGRSSKWKGEWTLTKDASTEKLNDVGLVVILRQTAKDKKILDLISAAHGRKIKVLFDLDDLIFDFRDLTILMSATNSKNLLYWMGYVWGIRRIAKKVDGFVTTNDFLAEKLKRSFKKKCVVIPNSLNAAQVEMAEKCLKNKKQDEFVIGYFSGSPTHTKDFKMVEPAIIRFLDAHRDARLKLVGMMELSTAVRERKGQVERIGLLDYLEQMKSMAETTVNIAPLTVNDFTNSKSELKYFEAAVVETVTVASPTYAFLQAIEDGENGFLAEPDEWYEKMEYLYNNSKKRQEVAKVARMDVLKKYYGKEFLKRVEEAYEKF